MDSFQGCYKDGTEQGTRDYRWFSAVYLALRCFASVVYSISTDGMYFPLCALILMMIILPLVVAQLYKSRVSPHYKSNSAFIILYATFYAAVSATDAAHARAHKYLHAFFAFTVTLAFVPLLCIFGFMFYWLFSSCRICLWLSHRFRWWHRGYASVSEDDAAVDTYCDRAVNPDAYSAVPSGGMVDCSTDFKRNER